MNITLLKELRNIMLRVDLCKARISLDLNLWSTNMWAIGILEGRDYQFLNIVFPFGPEFIDPVKGFVLDASINVVHEKYWELCLN